MQVRWAKSWVFIHKGKAVSGVRRVRSTWFKTLSSYALKKIFCLPQTATQNCHVWTHQVILFFHQSKLPGMRSFWSSPFFFSTAPSPHRSFQQASSSFHRSLTQGSHELPQHSPNPGGGGGSSWARSAARTSCLVRVPVKRLALFMRGTSVGAYSGAGDMIDALKIV